MTNWSTCCLTQTSLFCLQKTAGIRQANKDNITFRAAHKTWNAIYCEGSFQNMAAPAVRGDGAERLEPTSVEQTGSMGQRLHTLTCQGQGTERGRSRRTSSVEWCWGIKTPCVLVKIPHYTYFQIFILSTIQWGCPAPLINYKKTAYWAVYLQSSAKKNVCF